VTASRNRKPAAQDPEKTHSESDRNNEIPDFRLILQRILIGLAASSMLITAAGLSGLPSTSCTALAETYGRAITNFGFDALASMSVLVFILFMQEAWRHRTPKSDIPRFFQIAIVLISSLVIAIFMADSITGTENLNISVHHCLIGTDSKLTERLHKRVNLHSSYDLNFLFKTCRWTGGQPCS